MRAQIVAGALLVLVMNIAAAKPADWKAVTFDFGRALQASISMATLAIAKLLGGTMAVTAGSELGILQESPFGHTGDGVFCNGIAPAITGAIF